MKSLNPCLLSIDVDAGFSYAFHYSQDSDRYYNYLNYLPHIRGNLGIISIDYRYNQLTEYTNDFPESFRSWELLFLINLVPVESFKFTLGSGVYNELYTQNCYNEHYFGMELGLFQSKDFIELDSRLVVDYNRSVLPFFETGIRYKLRFINFPHAYSFLCFGAKYQNYYQSHDIWAANGGFLINIH